LTFVINVCSCFKVQPQASTNYDPLALIKKQVGHSDGERRQNLPSSTRRRYYSSSDDEDAPGAAPGPGELLTNNFAGTK
jgi:hypothetical protein